MDSIKDCKIPEYGDLSALVENKTECKIVVGAKQLRKALASQRAKVVYLAENADPALTDPLQKLSEECSVPCFWVRSMLDLGRACGIEVGAAAAAVLD